MGKAFIEGRSGGGAVYQGPITITPGAANQTFQTSGKKVESDLTVYGDADLTAGNIKLGKEIFGIQGTCKEFKDFTYWGYGKTGSKEFSKKFDAGSVTLGYFLVNPTAGFHVVGFMAASFDGSNPHDNGIFVTCNNVESVIISNPGGTPKWFYMLESDVFSGGSIYIPVKNDTTSGHTIIVFGYWE